MKKLREFNVECYFKNPETGECGWDIFIINIPATSRSEAAKIIQSMPYFDCFIENSFQMFNPEI